MVYQLNELTQPQIKQIGEQLFKGKIGVIPTDTIYGIVGSALKPETVEQIYKLRKRNLEKPMIILVGSLDQLKKFGVNLTSKQSDFLNQYWPNSLSVILPVDNPELTFLHRGKNSLAFRFPKLEWLQKILSFSGPLVAPSANFEGEEPAATISDAQYYFSDQVDFYIDNGELHNSASTLVDLTNKTPTILRQGAVKL